MQAIQTKFIAPTNHRGARIKASCERGSITIPWPDAFSGDEAHREAARQLIARFNAEDTANYGPASVEPGRGWNLPFVTGSLPDGTVAHVFITG
jgi:hypothetical protein